MPKDDPPKSPWFHGCLEVPSYENALSRDAEPIYPYLFATSIFISSSFFSAASFSISSSFFSSVYLFMQNTVFIEDIPT